MKYLINLFPADSQCTYNDFYWEMKRFGEPIPLSDFCWVIRAGEEPETILIRLRHCINDDDRIFICGFQNWVQANYSDKLLETLDE